MAHFGIVIHGGAGEITRDQIAPAQYEAYMEALRLALDTAYKVLWEGGASAEAVCAAVEWMENCPLFNAGKGSVLNRDGKVEMDAAIMDGASLSAGAVAGVSLVKNPVKLAMALTRQSPHVFLIGPQADEYARQIGLELENEAYFVLPNRLEQLRQTPDLRLDHDHKFGTVGAVALDKYGNLAAATSTGGMTGKLPGRVGDSPLIGAGTYAHNKSCAVSCTGHGEFFIRHVVAYSVASRMELIGEPLSKAADHLIYQTLVEAGGRGGLIAIDSNGDVAMPYNTAGMFRALRLSNGDFFTGV